MLNVSSAIFRGRPIAKARRKCRRPPGRTKSHNVVLGKARRFFDHDVLAGELRLHRAGEGVAVVRVRFRVEAENAMSFFAVAVPRENRAQKATANTVLMRD